MRREWKTIDSFPDVPRGDGEEASPSMAEVLSGRNSRNGCF